MAQVSALMADDLQIQPSHRLDVSGEAAGTAVHLHGRLVQAIVTDFRVTPTLADLEGRPIEILSTLQPAIERSLKGENRLEFHKALLANEKKANEDLVRCTQKYGYHYIFRAGLQSYYMTKTVVARISFWRPDVRGDEYRVNVQKLSYDALENRRPLNDADKRFLIDAMACVPADAYRFWTWLEKSRVPYNAMQACILMLDNIRKGKYTVGHG
ncbi:hypothetical protein FE257_008721 [Aspergillus nanangensis]|uniref:Uncharacterized protein n=1 Tax=Aspergillus nanangensis TaxID=2582783 RepID=A0AAD4CLH7_ASPNN|nr:hypothetical protein FE257_008721 [Aspergillus nanangensis]